MLAPIDPRISNWPGGNLTVKGELVAPYVVEAWPLSTDETFPLNKGLAFPRSVTVPVDTVAGVLVQIECRSLEIQAVAVLSTPEDGPELTQSVLRKIGSLRDIARKAANTKALRLHLDENGEIYGVPLGDPLAKLLNTQPAANGVAADVTEHAVKRTGRPPLSEDILREVAAVVAEAKTSRKPIAKTVAEHFNISEAKAKKRIRIARDRGYWSV